MHIRVLDNPRSRCSLVGQAVAGGWAGRVGGEVARWGGAEWRGVGQGGQVLKDELLKPPDVSLNTFTACNSRWSGPTYCAVWFNDSLTDTSTSSVFGHLRVSSDYFGSPKIREPGPIA